MIRKVIFVLGLLLVTVSVRANDIYITQSGTGGGTSCANPLGAAFFNNAANWGTGQGQIGPGTTVHLCGTFTGAAGATMLTARGSGTSASPITILFEPGAKLTAPYWAAAGAIVLSGRSWIVVNGDINNGRQGIIQNTDNGSNKTYQQQTRGIYASGCPNCTVKNLTVADFYDKLADVAITSITANGTTATVTCASACNNKVNHAVAIVGNSLIDTGTNSVTITSTPDSTHFTFSSTANGTGTGGVVTDSGIDYSAENAVYGGINVSPNFTIDNVLAHDMGSPFVGWAQNYTIKNSEVYNADHGIIFGVSANVGGLDIHGNHFHDFAAWDTANDKYHHDYIHLYDKTMGTSITDGVVYNNVFDGVFGNCCTTAHLFLQGAVNNVTIFNNTFIESGTTGRQAIWMDGATFHQQNTAIYNNFFSMGGHQVGGGIYSAGDLTGLKAENNIVIGGYGDISLQNSAAVPGVDYNLYDDLYTDYADPHTFNFNNMDTHDFATWKSDCGCDPHSQIATHSVINVNSSGVPQTGSPALNNGINLSSIAIGAKAPLAKDITGKLRPGGTTAWDIGAYQH